MRSLVQDTFYRRARGSLTGSFHAADDFVRRIFRSKIRILLEAASPLSLTIVRPVLSRLLRDTRLEFWFMTSDRSWSADSIFHKAGITERVVTAEDVRWGKFDAYINTDFWNTTWLPRRVKRIHFFHGVAGKYELDAPTSIAPVVASFDRLLFPNRDRLDRYVRAGLVEAEGKRGALVGYPKTDCLVDGSLDRKAIEQSLGLDPGRPTVLYAPTWSPYSSLNAVGTDVIQRLARLNVNVIIKLHDRSYDLLARSSGGIDWRQRLDALCRSRGVHIAKDADVTPYLFVSDLLITDHSSVGFEFMLLDRPIVVLDCPQLIAMARVSADKVKLLRRAAHVARTGDDVALVVTRALEDPARFSAERRATAADMFYSPGGATARAVQCVYDLLSLPEPDGVCDSTGQPEAEPVPITPTISG